MAQTNYRTWLARILPRRPFGGRLGRRMGGVFGLVFDGLGESVRQAVRASWIGDSLGPAVDALVPGGNELSLPRYPVESNAQYESRLERAWQDWGFAGTEATMAAQLDAAGFPGAQIKTTADWPTRPPLGYWSQFWVFFPQGTHHVTGAGPTIGSFTIGDGTVLGATGITLEEVLTMRAIIAKWKPGRWICRGIVFEMSGWTIGGGRKIGEPGLVIGGGQQVVIGA